MRPLAVIAAAALLASAGCSLDAPADPNIAGPKKASAGATRTVTYRVAGTARRADLTYATASGTEQTNGTKLPWKKTFKVSRDDITVLTIDAQNTGTGTITCEIEVDGRRVKAGKGRGEFAGVSCDHDIGF